MIVHLRQILESGAFQQRLTALASGAPAATPVSLTVDLGPGHEDWLALADGKAEHFWYWAQPDRGEYRLGLGHALQVASAGPNRFAALSHAFAGLSSHWRHDSPPSAFLGFAFDEAARSEFPNALLAIPAVMLHCRQGHCSATFTTLAAALSGKCPGTVAAWSSLLAGRPIPRPWAPPRRLPQPLAERAWLAKVQAALRDIAAGRLEKVVLSRRVRLGAKHPIAPVPLLAALVQRQPGSTIYAHGNRQAVFLGASPERLVTLQDGQVKADALAGTAWPGSASLRGDKNSREQSLVTAAIRAALTPLCGPLSESTAPQTLQVGQLTHLRTCLGGPVAPGVTLFDLIRALHPTPAVGGSPTPAALDWLRRQGEERGGWYSGGIGCLDAGGEGEIAVALRCALISGKEAELQAGAGIVAGSQPEQELAETEAKLATLLDVLLLPGQETRTGT